MPSVSWHRSALSGSSGVDAAADKSAVDHFDPTPNLTNHLSSEPLTTIAASSDNTIKVINSHVIGGENPSDWISSKLILNPLRASDFKQVFKCRATQNKSLSANMIDQNATTMASFTLDMNRK